jgi:hypothetical protein
MLHLGTTYLVLFLKSFRDSGENNAPLTWDLRVNIALDVARGLEYLHDGVSCCEL